MINQKVFYSSFHLGRQTEVDVNRTAQTHTDRQGNDQLIQTIKPEHLTQKLQFVSMLTMLTCTYLDVFLLCKMVQLTYFVMLSVSCTLHVLSSV